MRRFARRALPVALLAALLVPALAGAHIERASYWPDPSADTSVTPPVGGAVPKARSLASALPAKKAKKRKRKRKRRARATRVGTTRVVCQSDSLKRLKSSIRDAAKHGYDIRPTDHRSLSAKRARRLLRINGALMKLCRYREIQPAVTDSHNDDRVVIMPGVYTEPTARKQPGNGEDPKCADLKEQNDRQVESGQNQSGAVSYAYQVKCPNDQNLIAVIGRANGSGKDPQPPLDDRHKIPNLGPCIRCNLQMEGSGVGPDDVVVDAGRVESGNHGPIDAKKDVGIRADRADGFVLRNLTVRHAGEHDVYILESDGYLFDRLKTFYAGEYGVLTFVEDHGLMENCEAAGHGDSGLYPGAAADTGDQHLPGDGPRYNQEIRNCDMHHNAAGYSGTDGNAVHVHDNNFYDNALGFTTDVFTAAGHPGFPQDSDLIENNNFYSNNFNPYVQGSDVKPAEPFPVGTGLWIAGGNHNLIRNNRFWDNWRRGTMVFAVPDATVCAPPEHQAGCDPARFSTSYNNQNSGNTMGIAPNGTTQPNGTDFWWDNYLGNTGNCWYGNTAAPGRQITSTPDSLPDCDNGKDPSSSSGTGGPAQDAELLNCLADYTFDTGSCDWFVTPPKPSS